MASKLAIHGGERVVTIKDPEQWKPPIEEEKKLINQLLDQRFLSGSGKGLPKEFEDEFRDFIGCGYCLTTSHGAGALGSAFYAAGVGPGDEVIVATAVTILSFATALHMGARPVLCDIDPKTLMIDPKDVERKITSRTRAIIAVDYFGNICDMDSLWEIGKKYGITVIEDAAHVHGAEWEGKKLGKEGDIACFSMQGSVPAAGKPVSGGEGGIVTTNNQEFYERMLAYCHLHRNNVEVTNPAYRMLRKPPGVWRGLGLKWRAHPLAIALAKVSLGTLEYRIEKSNMYLENLFDALRKLPGLEPEHSYPKAKRMGLFGGLNIIYHPEELGGLSIESFVEALKAEGAPVKGGGIIWGEHRYPLFSRGFDLWGHNRGPLGGEWCGLPPYKGYKESDFPVAKDLQVLTLPTAYIEPKEGFFSQYIKAFKKITGNYQSLLSK